MSTLRIGSIELAVVSDGRLRMDPSLMFGPDQPDEFRRHIELDEGRVPFSVNCVLVRVGERRLLLDTGTGTDDPSMVQRYGTDIGHLPCPVPVGTVSGWPSGAGLARSATFQSRTVWSLLPVANVWPSGLNTAVVTVSSCPVSGLPSGRTLVGSSCR